MTDVVGMFAGIRPLKNASEFGFSDYSPSMAQFDDKLNHIRNPAPGYNTPPSKTPREMEFSMYRSTLSQVLPQKGEPESVRFGKPMSDLNSHMYPHTGYARHQNLGLAYDSNKPINGPIMPISGFFDPEMLNVLGGLK
jgi:hypothetical protein